MEKAKEAYKKERLIIKQREEKNLTDQSNTELTGFVSRMFKFKSLIIKV